MVTRPEGTNAWPDCGARADEELAAEDVDGNLVAAIALPIWARSRLAGLDLAVLVAAERGGPAEVDSLMRRRVLCSVPTGALSTLSITSTIRWD
jgi:hypothetical protein